MKRSFYSFLFFALITAASLQAAQKLHECRVYKVVNDNIWEEGLGVYGDPQADSDSQTVELTVNGKSVESVRVGQMAWRRTNGDGLSVHQEGETITYEVHPKRSKSTVQVKVYGSEYGIVLRKAGSKGAYELVAKIDCSDEAVMRDRYGADANSLDISPTMIKKKYPTAFENIDRIDFQVELGDADINIHDISYYRVISGSIVRDTVGWLAVVDYENTEMDGKAQATFRFDRNGCLLWDPELEEDI